MDSTTAPSSSYSRTIAKFNGTNYKPWAQEMEGFLKEDAAKL
ncbi:hypothetical protein PIIN_11640 [Serendipita indica DSM 11827]|uniref:DUF4219 domain-containing protein n=1 Tax=Serendipita indica (strain DSM 11827) TaxID=1109443 RepID=G4U269_SERID|nr:hypothetical protein PIIN_11640 [Serendipita indica DSM 11827]